MFNVCKNTLRVCIYICYKLQSQSTLISVHVFFKDIPNFKTIQVNEKH